MPLQERIARKLKIPLPLAVTVRSLASLTSLLRMICGLTMVSVVCKYSYVLCRLNSVIDYAVARVTSDVILEELTWHVDFFQPFVSVLIPAAC